MFLYDVSLNNAMTNRVSMSFTPNEIKLIDQIAERMGEPRSSVVKTIVVIYIMKEDKKML